MGVTGVLRRPFTLVAAFGALDAVGFASVAWAAATVSVASLLVFGCGGGGGGRTISLRMQGGPPNATVTIDDERVGPLAVVAAHGVALPPGRHRVTVEAPGYLPYDHLVEATSAPVRLEVALVPIPD